MVALSKHGVSVELPTGFEGRAGQQPLPPGEVSTNATSEPGAPDSVSPLALVHVATVPIPTDVGDYGSKVVDILGTDDVFVSLVEFSPELAGSVLFASRGIPGALGPDSFSSKTLQRWMQGQSGVQRFFSVSGRAFCLYAVLGSDAKRAALSAKVNAVIGSLNIDPLTGTTAPPAPPATPGTTAGEGNVADLIAGQADLAVFASLVSAARSRAQLAGPGPFTVFAPTDAAFASDDVARLRRSPDLAHALVDRHVVAGDAHTDALVDGRVLSTTAGSTITVERHDTVITVDGARLVRPDLDATNGTVHVVDRQLGS